jgi:hypothetical protein
MVEAGAQRSPDGGIGGDALGEGLAGCIEPLAARSSMATSSSRSSRRILLQQQGRATRTGAPQIFGHLWHGDEGGIDQLGAIEVGIDRVVVMVEQTLIEIEQGCDDRAVGRLSAAPRDLAATASRTLFQACCCA